MKIKTITNYNKDKFDEAVNDFMANNTVNFTQTHVVIDGAQLLVYSAVLFYVGV